MEIITFHTPEAAFRIRHRHRKHTVTPLILRHSVTPPHRIATLLSPTRLVPENYWCNHSPAQLPAPARCRFRKSPFRTSTCTDSRTVTEPTECHTFHAGLLYHHVTAQADNSAQPPKQPVICREVCMIRQAESCPADRKTAAQLLIFHRSKKPAQ